MNDKRDEVIDAATDCLVKRKMKNLNTKYFSVSTEEMADFAIQHALSREAELRAEVEGYRAIFETARRIEFQNHSSVSRSTINGVWRWWGDTDVRASNGLVHNDRKGFDTALEAYQATDAAIKPKEDK